MSLLVKREPVRGLVAKDCGSQFIGDGIRERGARVPPVIEKVVEVKRHNYPATRKSTKRKLTPGKKDPNAWAKREYGEV